MNGLRRHAGFSAAFLACVSFLLAPLAPAESKNIRDYGAKGDGTTLDGGAIQTAIDACHQSGGGTVLVPPGTYLTGGLVLKSRVRLHLENGATLLGSTRLEDYPQIIPAHRSYTDNYTERSLITAENAEQVAVTGGGVIDGQGAAFTGEYKMRPYMFRFISCTGVLLEGLRLQNGPMWTVHLLACDDARVTGVTIRSRVNKNNDGLDIDSCSNVCVSDCDISSGDDAIVLKSTSPRPCERIAVTNCIVSSTCNALKMGTESNGGFKNITIGDCVVYDTELSGLALEIVDGGAMDGVVVSNIAMRNVGCPVFIRQGDRARPHIKDGEKPGVGSMKNITISNIDATVHDPTGCSVTGLPDHPVENVSLSRLRFRFPGGGAEKWVSRSVPEQREKYPEHKMFDHLPAYGFYLRHVRNVSLDGVDLGVETADARPALVCADGEDLVLNGVRAAASHATPGLFWLDGTRNARITQCAAGEGTGVFLHVSGAGSAGILLDRNDLRNAEKDSALAKGLSRRTLRSRDNWTK